ncbi:hypothetical protein M3231_08615 [Neobacillus mesonae]|nr:hypothetical protein [Neobacillus mesonae]
MDQRRQCAQCGERLENNVFKCKNCGELAVKKSKTLNVNDLPGEDLFYLDGYSAILLILLTILLPPIAALTGTLMLFHDDGYRRDVGKLMVTGGLIMTVIYGVLIIRM